MTVFKPFHFLVLTACLCRVVAGFAAADAPAVFWASDPVRPDDTVLAIGNFFGEAPVIEAARLDDKDAAGAISWTHLPCLQPASTSVKFTLPADWRPGCYVFRIANGAVLSKQCFLNAPDCRWAQGDEGDKATPGGWIRVLGKCLSLGSMPGVAENATRVRLVRDGKKTALPLEEVTAWSVKGRVPETLPHGTYALELHNGFGGDQTWRSAGEITIAPPPVWPQEVFNVKELGLEQALAQAATNGGGIVYFPRGTYTVRDQVAVEVPDKTVLRGEDEKTCCLSWRDMDEPPDALIVGKTYAVENLSVFCQNFFKNVIEVKPGSERFRLNNVRIRADTFYTLGHGNKGDEFRDRILKSTHGGDAVNIRGARNFAITGSDIYIDHYGLRISASSYGTVAGNVIQYGVNGFGISGMQKGIVENNRIEGCDPGATGNYVNNGDGQLRGVYVAGNTFCRAYGWDREVFTFDLSDGAYFGHPASVEGTRVVLAHDPKGNHSAIKSSRWIGSVICVYEGRGTGQYRFVTAREGREWTVDRPWDVPPDENSVIGIIPFMGSIFFIGNTLMDAGIVQTYKTSIDNVFAENRFIRSSGLVILCGRSDKGANPRQVSWYNQGLDNEFPEGMDWGGHSSGVSFSADNGGALSYWGPVSMGGVARRNVFHNMGMLRVSGCWDVLVEHCAVHNSATGVRVDATRGNGSPQDREKGAPRRVLFRKNTFENVDRLYDGNIKPETYLVDPVKDLGK